MLATIALCSRHLPSNVPISNTSQVNCCQGATKTPPSNNCRKLLHDAQAVLLLFSGSCMCYQLTWLQLAQEQPFLLVLPQYKATSLEVPARSSPNRKLGRTGDGNVKATSQRSSELYAHNAFGIIATMLSAQPVAMNLDLRVRM